jgi:hypothetical protein
MLLRADGGNHYSHLKVTVEGGLNGIVNEINKENVAENPGSSFLDLNYA